MTHLDHDHRKRENVPFPTVFSPTQDLWCSPALSVTTSSCGIPNGVQVLSDCSKAEVRDAHSTRIIHKDVWLSGCQCGCERGSKEVHTPLRSPWITLQECRYERPFATSYI